MLGTFWFLAGLGWSFFVGYQWWYFACQSKAEYKITLIIDRSLEIVKDDSVSDYRRYIVSKCVGKVSVSDVLDDYMKLKDPFAGYPLLFRLELGV